MHQRPGKRDVDDGGRVQTGHAPNRVSRFARHVLQEVDVYPKLHREFKVQTESGAVISVVAGIVMVVLFLSELRAYWRVQTHEHMVVDTSLGEKLQVNLNVSFLAINCHDAHLNAMDVAGDLQVNLHETVVRTRLDANGYAMGHPLSIRPLDTGVAPRTDVPAGFCGSCYGATHPSGTRCCNTCEHVQEAFFASHRLVEEADSTDQCRRERGDVEPRAQDGEGCRFTGNMFVNRVSGNVHVALGRTFHRNGKLVHQFRPGDELLYNSSHIIHSLSFGEPMPGVTGALDGVARIASQFGGVFQYYIKIVPTIFSDMDENAIHSYQYSVTKQVSYLNLRGPMTALPGTFFVFDFSPFMVKVENDRMPFTHFLTKICAIVGGVISIAGFVDSFMYNSLQVRRRTTTSGGASK